MRELPTIVAAAKASPAKVHKLWKGLGYYTRVRNLQKAAQQISSQPGGAFPEDFDDILALPGIGRYTAGAIASIAFNEPHPILDGNVIRVLTRIFGITANPRDKETNARLWQLAEALVTRAKDAEDAKGKSNLTLRPSRSLRETDACSCLNQSLMELGALICTARAPQCDDCPVAQLCIARAKGWQERLPNLDKRAVTTERRFLAFVVVRRGKFLVRQRPEGVVNAHLWEFPNVEVGAIAGRAHHSVRAGIFLTGSGAQRTDAPCLLKDFSTTSAKPLCTIKHSITRYRITLEAWRAQLKRASSKNSKSAGRWLAPKQLHRLAFTAAHRRILHAAVDAQ